MKRRLARIAGIAILTASIASPLSSHAATTELHGYITMSDGTLLKYTVDLPAATGRFPVAFVYDPYNAGDGPITDGAQYGASLLFAAGFAVIGVNIRGTGCSGGTFDLLSHQAWSDGAEVVEWAAVQPWSNGRVGMFGLSYPGISQLGVASLRPPHLLSIAPFSVVADTYRDVAYPGGIFNLGFAGVWSLAGQPEPSYSSAGTAVQQQDPVCAANVARHAEFEPAGNTFPIVAAHPFDDTYWKWRAPGANASNIDVPVLACHAWQDDQVSSREGDSYLNQLNPERTWIVGMNGYHGVCDDPANEPMQMMLVEFFEHFVAGDASEFHNVPHVQIFHEVTNGANYSVRWVTTLPSWPPTVSSTRLYLRGNGALANNAESLASSSDTYVYPMPGSSTEDTGVREYPPAGPNSKNAIELEQNNLLWKAPVVQAGSLSYTTPALSNDAEFYGPGSADLWLSSTATDTDLQITLSEVRPDGQELYVQRGWLRASHRKLDADRSTELLPYQTHLASDAEPLTPGTPTLVRVELFPFDHVFRAGSSIRLTIDAPASVTGFWSLDFLKTPAINTILHDATHQSSLVLGYVPGGTAQGLSFPTCDTLLNQPCRTNTTPVPPGTLTITPEEN
ncbi:MAG: CocE/NonD family hydrolase [Actinomycetota bacterium]